MYFPLSRGSGSRHVLQDALLCLRNWKKEGGARKQNMVCFTSRCRHVLLNTSSLVVDGEKSSFHFVFFVLFYARFLCWPICCNVDYWYTDSFQAFKKKKSCNDVWRKQSTLRLKYVTQHFHLTKQTLGAKPLFIWISKKKRKIYIFFLNFWFDGLRAFFPSRRACLTLDLSVKCAWRVFNTKSRG